MSRLSLRAPVADAPSLPDLLTFSRVISGRGGRAFTRMHTLHVAIIGVSGLGSPAAETLVKEYGVREITLIDPDVVGAENLHRMQGAGMDDIGRPKVEAVRDYLKTLGPVTVYIVNTEVMRWSALNRLKAAEIWISAVDDAPTRAQVQCLAQLYLRPLLDIGTGALLDEAVPATPETTADDALSELVGPYAHTAAPRSWAADIRLATPGVRGGCLACLGGFGDLRRARRDADTPFWLKRPSSNRLVNMATVHHGLALLENYVAGTLPDASLHLQLDFPPDGVPRLNRVAPTPRLACPVCGLAGLGDYALDRLEPTLNALQKNL